LSYEEFPKRIYTNQLFSVTIKAVAAKEKFQDLYYTFEENSGVSIVSEKHERVKKGIAYYETFYFKAMQKEAQTPNIVASLVFENYSGALAEKLEGKQINTMQLHPDESYSGVLAQSMRVDEYKTANYDSNNNIVIFTLSATMANLENFVLSGIEKQGVEEISDNLPHRKATYYAIIPSFMQELKFSYFNLEKQKFEKLLIPIIVSDDSVSTQTDLNPYETNNTPLIAAVSASFALLFFIIFLFRRRIKYIFLTLTFAGIVIYLYFPAGKVCIKANSSIFLLPMHNGTIFTKTETKMEFDKIKRLNDFIKVKLENNQIGWVYYEDICTN